MTQKFSKYFLFHIAKVIDKFYGSRDHQTGDNRIKSPFEIEITIKNHSFDFKKTASTIEKIIKIVKEGRCA